MKILLTGSSGFIGKAYRLEIEKRGDTIIPFDLPENDITNDNDLIIAIGKANVVFHMAAVADLYKSAEMPDKNFEVNIRGTYNVAKYCRELGCSLIFCSTCCVYGNSRDTPSTEDKTLPMCCELYATSKIAGEDVIRGIQGLEYIIVRPGTVYGPGMREALFNFIALDRCRRGEKIYIDGDGKQTRQYIYIDDLVRGFRLVTERFADFQGEIFNFCGQLPISVNEVIKTVEQITGRSAVVEHRPDRYGQTLNESISCMKANQKLGWLAETQFKDGMKKTFESDPRFHG